MAGVVNAGWWIRVCVEGRWHGEDVRVARVPSAGDFLLCTETAWKVVRVCLFSHPTPACASGRTSMEDACVMAPGDRYAAHVHVEEELGT